MWTVVSSPTLASNRSHKLQYTEAVIGCRFAEEYLCDLFVQGLGDMGFESFVTDDDGTLHAYIQTDVLNEEELRQFVAQQAQQLVALSPVQDENWNAAWEAEHPVMELPLGVHIVPHCAFGAGYHETTSMLIDRLLQTDLTGATVLDMGCGTGVLGIFAGKRGAAHVVAVDIDDKAVANAQENAALNGVTLDAQLGSTPPEGQYDLILANIHRNILIAQMADYARFLKPNGQLWLSGFYEEDVAPITEEATSQHLTVTGVYANGDWRMMVLQPKTTNQ